MRTRRFAPPPAGAQWTAFRPAPTMHLPWLQPGDPFPDPSQAWDEQQPAPGLLAAGGALDVDTLQRAYARGIFPWFSDGQPILWWSTDPRMVLYTAEFRLHRSLRKTLAKFAADPRCEIRFDHDFQGVIRACATSERPGQSGTWIVPAMVKQKYGRIVNIASIAGKEGNPNAAHYSASKAGLIALTKSLGKELAAHDITVNAVTPAAAKTAIFDQMTEQHINFMLSKIPKNRFVLVEELAAMVAWLASEDCSFSTGAVFDISGGRATY